LAPLCEIMRQRRHPVTGQTMEEMYKALRPNEN
jgi:2-amino-4-hydroxy-6-hydroxymethyldihydropteridine diphosphokinase